MKCDDWNIAIMTVSRLIQIKFMLLKSYVAPHVMKLMVNNQKFKVDKSISISKFDKYRFK